MKPLSLLFLAIIAVGCGAPSDAPKPVQADSIHTTQRRQALRDLANLPAAERAEFLRNHPSVFPAIKLKGKTSPKDGGL